MKGWLSLFLTISHTVDIGDKDFQMSILFLMTNPIDLLKNFDSRRLESEARDAGLFCALMQKIVSPCEMWTISKSSLLIFNLSRTNSGID